MEYILGLVWILMASVLGQSKGMYRRERVLGREERRIRWIYALMITLPILALAGMRNIYFGDTPMYIRSFQAIPSSLRGKWDYAMISNTKDHGFYLLNAVLSIFIGRHARVYLIILVLIQGFCLMKTYRKYSVDYWFSIFVFVASTDIYSWMYNGIRQFMAVTIIFAASDWIFGRKYFRAILAILFASLFHRSALLMIPVIFIVQGKPWNWKTLFVIFGAVLVMNFSGLFTDVLDTALENTQYRNVVGDWQSGGDDGTNPIRVLVYSVPTILSLFCRRKIQSSGDRVIQICCNMSIISTALYLVSMVTSGIFMGRLPIYCSLYATGILLPWELKYVFGKPVRLAAIVCFVLYFYIQMRMAWGVI